jgi:hypothetical protein
MSTGRDLYGEWRLGIVISTYCDSLPAVAMCATILDFRGELLDLYKVIVIVLVLNRCRLNKN